MSIARRGWDVSDPGAAFLQSTLQRAGINFTNTLFSLSDVNLGALFPLSLADVLLYDSEIGRWTNVPLTDVVNLDGPTAGLPGYGNDGYPTAGLGPTGILYGSNPGSNGLLIGGNYEVNTEVTPSNTIGDSVVFGSGNVWDTSLGNTTHVMVGSNIGISDTLARNTVIGNTAGVGQQGGLVVLGYAASNQNPGAGLTLSVPRDAYYTEPASGGANPLAMAVLNVEITQGSDQSSQTTLTHWLPLWPVPSNFTPGPNSPLFPFPANTSVFELAVNALPGGDVWTPVSWQNGSRDDLNQDAGGSFTGFTLTQPGEYVFDVLVQVPFDALTQGVQRLALDINSGGFPYIQMAMQNTTGITNPNNNPTPLKFTYYFNGTGATTVTVMFNSQAAGTVNLAVDPNSSFTIRYLGT